MATNRVMEDDPCDRKLLQIVTAWVPKPGFNKITRNSTESWNSTTAKYFSNTVPDEWNNPERAALQSQSVGTLKNPVEMFSSDVLMREPQGGASEQVKSRHCLSRSHSVPAINMPVSFMKSPKQTAPSPIQLNVSPNGQRRKWGSAISFSLNASPVNLLPANSFGMQRKKAWEGMPERPAVSQGHESPVTLHTKPDALQSLSQTSMGQGQQRPKSAMQQRRTWGSMLESPASSKGSASPTPLHANKFDAARSPLSQSPTTTLGQRRPMSAPAGQGQRRPMSAPTGVGQRRPQSATSFGMQRRKSQENLIVLKDPAKTQTAKVFAAKIFDLLDTNGDGFVDRSEWAVFNEMVHRLSPEFAYMMPSHRLAKRAEAEDLDEDDEVDEHVWMEYIMGITEIVGPQVWEAAAKKLTISLSSKLVSTKNKEVSAIIQKITHRIQHPVIQNHLLTLPEAKHISKELQGGTPVKCVVTLTLKQTLTDGPVTCRQLAEGIAKATGLLKICIDGMDIPRHNILFEGQESPGNQKIISLDWTKMHFDAFEGYDLMYFILAEFLKDDRCCTQELYLNVKELHIDAAYALGEALRVNKTLTFVRLGAHIPHEQIRSNQVQEIDWTSKGVNSCDLIVLVSLLKDNWSVRVLKLSENTMDAMGAKALCELLATSTSIVAVDLSLNPNLGDETMDYVKNMLLVNRSLQVLTLRGIGLEDKGALSLADALPMCGLKELYLEYNKIGGLGCTKLSSALKVSPQLRALYLANNRVPAEVKRQCCADSSRLFVEAPATGQETHFSIPTTNYPCHLGERGPNQETQLEAEPQEETKLEAAVSASRAGSKLNACTRRAQHAKAFNNINEAAPQEESQAQNGEKTEQMENIEGTCPGMMGMVKSMPSENPQNPAKNTPEEDDEDEDDEEDEEDEDEEDEEDEEEGGLDQADNEEEDEATQKELKKEEEKQHKKEQEQMRQRQQHKKEQEQMQQQQQQKKEEEQSQQRQAKLRKIVEYYLSDGRLKYDKFLHEKISEDPEGWLDLRFILSRNKIKVMNATQELVVDALRDSSIEVRNQSGYETAVRRLGNRELPTLKQRRW